MKKFFLTFVAVLCSTVMALADDNNGLIVTFNDGTTQSFLLSDLPDVKMENDKMTITAGSTTAQYDLYTVKTFTFGAVSTGITSVKDSKLTLKGDVLIVPSAKAKVNVYAIDGAAVNAKVSRGNETTVVDLSSLPTGRVYIIKADGKSVKILK